MEYLFRGRTNTIVDEWIYGEHYTFKTNAFISPSGAPCSLSVYPSSVGLWSGLTTTGKDPVKVFEGDIIATLDTNGVVVRSGIVRLGRYNSDGDHHMGFYVEWVSGTAKSATRKDLIYWIEYAGAQVIGNTTDNPELVGVTEK